MSTDEQNRDELESLLRLSLEWKDPRKLCVCGRVLIPGRWKDTRLGWFRDNDKECAVCQYERLEDEISQEEYYFPQIHDEQGRKHE